MILLKTTALSLVLSLGFLFNAHTAARGEDALRPQRRITVVQRQDLETALAAQGTPARKKNVLIQQLSAFGVLQEGGFSGVAIQRQFTGGRVSLDDILLSLGIIVNAAPVGAPPPPGNPPQFLAGVDADVLSPNRVDLLASIRGHNGALRRTPQQNKERTGMLGVLDRRLAAAAYSSDESDGESSTEWSDEEGEDTRRRPQAPRAQVASSLPQQNPSTLSAARTVAHAPQETQRQPEVDPATVASPFTPVSHVSPPQQPLDVEPPVRGPLFATLVHHSTHDSATAAHQLPSPAPILGAPLRQNSNEAHEEDVPELAKRAEVFGAHLRHTPRKPQGSSSPLTLENSFGPLPLGTPHDAQSLHRTSPSTSLAQGSSLHRAGRETSLSHLTPSQKAVEAEKLALQREEQELQELLRREEQLRRSITHKKEKIERTSKSGKK